MDGCVGVNAGEGAGETELFPASGLRHSLGLGGSSGDARPHPHSKEQRHPWRDTDLKFYLNINYIVRRYRYRLYHTDQHRTGTDNYSYSNGQQLRVYWLYWGDNWIYIQDR